MINLIVAMTSDGIIGKDGTLPWHIPADLKHFKALTTNCGVIMGRKTFDSLKMPNGLPNRYNIVISRTPHEETPIMAPVSWATTLIDGIKRAKISSPYQDIFIIGGATIYKEALDNDLVDCIHVSFVKERYTGDTSFPIFDKSLWDDTDPIDMGDFIYVKYNKKK